MPSVWHGAGGELEYLAHACSLIHVWSRNSSRLTHPECCSFFVDPQPIRIYLASAHSSTGLQIKTRRQRTETHGRRGESRDNAVRIQYNVMHVNGMLPSRTYTANGWYRPLPPFIADIEAPIHNVLRYSPGPTTNAFFPCFTSVSHSQFGFFMTGSFVPLFHDL